MAFNFITICDGISIPQTQSKIYRAPNQTNITYGLCSNNEKIPIQFSVLVNVNGNLTPIIPFRQVPAGGTDMCNELKGLLLNKNDELDIQSKQDGLYFRASGFTFS